VQVRAHGPCRQVERAGDPGAVQIGPGVQQQHFALVGGEVGERGRDAPCRGGRVDPLGHTVAGVVGVRVAWVVWEAGIGSQATLLGACVLAQQVRSDPVQPRGRVRLPRPVVPPPRECLGEGLGGKVVGQFGTDPAPQVAVDRREMPVEQLSKACRLRQRRGDQLGIVRSCPPSSGIVTRFMTAATVGVAPTPFRSVSAAVGEANACGPRLWPSG
jgi:hypothetical protein